MFIGEEEEGIEICTKDAELLELITKLVIYQ